LQTKTSSGPWCVETSLPIAGEWVDGPATEEARWAKPYAYSAAGVVGWQIKDVTVMRWLIEIDRVGGELPGRQLDMMMLRLYVIRSGTSSQCEPKP